MMTKIIFIVCIISTSICQAQLPAKLDAVLNKQPVSKSGFALLIEQDGKTIYQKTAGIANDSTGELINAATNFRLASVSKQFTAMAILLLEKEYKLSLGDAIVKYLPGMPSKIGHQITVQHLLTHTSGLLDYEELMSPDQKTQLMDTDVLQLLQKKDSTYFIPGSHFRYSNSGFCLLAMIIESVSHQSFSSFIKAKIFVPLQMDYSSVFNPGQTIANRAMGYAKDSAGNTVFSDQSLTSATKGDGGIYTSLNDYKKWIHALQKNTLINLPNSLHGLRFNISHDIFYGAGWFDKITQPEMWFHSGSTCGFNNYVILVPAQKFSVVFFSNLADNLECFKQIVDVLKAENVGDFTATFSLHDLTR